MIASLLRHSNRLYPVVCLTLGAGLFLPGSAIAEFLADDGNALPGWHGTQEFGPTAPFDNPFLSFSADVDFAVYAPGSFNRSFPGLDPSDGQDFVYAYQIFNTGGPGADSVRMLSVGLDGDEAVRNIGSIAASQPPDFASLQGSPPSYTSAVWSYSMHSLRAGDPGAKSAILVYTSSDGPELDTAIVLAGLSAGQHELPSPVPEPGTLILLGLAAGLLWLWRRAAGRS